MQNAAAIIGARPARYLTMQVALTVLIVGMITYAVGVLNFRSLMNATWMIGVPVSIALVCNNRWRGRLLVAPWLVICSLIAVMFTANVFGLRN